MFKYCVSKFGGWGSDQKYCNWEEIKVRANNTYAGDGGWVGGGGGLRLVKHALEIPEQISKPFSFFSIQIIIGQKNYMTS